jgi:glycosyltransferase involved in cell wall biosynthesis
LEGRTEFLGSLSNEETCAAIANADYSLHLSNDEPTSVRGGSYLHCEGMGRAVLEAITAGTFVIAARTGALPEVVGPGSGTLVDELRPESVARALARVVRESPRRRPWSDLYSWVNYFSAYEGLWRARCVR